MHCKHVGSHTHQKTTIPKPIKSICNPHITQCKLYLLSCSMLEVFYNYFVISDLFMHHTNVGSHAALLVEPFPALRTPEGFLPRVDPRVN